LGSSYTDPSKLKPVRPGLPTLERQKEEVDLVEGYEEKLQLAQTHLIEVAERAMGDKQLFEINRDVSNKEPRK
jgi:hypothetical protein